jgi:hypothetical protein
MRTIPTFAATLALVALAWGGDTTVSSTPSAKKKAPTRRSAATAAAKKSPGKSVAHKSSASGAGTATARRGKKPPTPRTTWRNRQTTPTPDRFKEIQTALVDKGYLAPEGANGTWDQSSEDALKKFQADQNLESTGKINSLSLIALGLGPRHESALSRPPDVSAAQPESSGRN